MPPAIDSATEYRLLSPEKVGPLPEIDVLGIHFLKVLPDRRDAFERFVRDTLHPAVRQPAPQSPAAVLQGRARADTPGYILLFALTKQSRDKYWPGGSDSDVLRAAFGPVKVHTKELDPLTSQARPLLTKIRGRHLRKPRVDRPRVGAVRVPIAHAQPPVRAEHQRGIIGSRTADECSLS